MVHALDEIHRVLLPGGLLLDLRPTAAAWPVEVTWQENMVSTGRLSDLPGGLSEDQMSNNAISEVAQRGWFTLQNDLCYEVFIYWDNPEEMKTYIRNKWEDCATLDEITYQRTVDIWSIAGMGKRVRTRVKMHQALWRKQV